MSRPLAISLILVAFFLGTGFGFFVTPEYAGLASGDPMGDAPADRLSDLRFINGLIRHHEQAVDFARQAKDGAGRPETRALAEAVLAGMPAKIDELYAWKKGWYRDARRMSPEKIALGTADAQFDLRYLNAMITHHREAIAMAGAALKTSTRNEVLTLASEVIRLDTADLAQFEAWRSAWYGAK
jgi:uncharacterized protein (DUF305 family)